MFGREFKTKLLELRPNKSVLDESIRNQDWNQKLSGKVYADKRQHTLDNPITSGGTRTNLESAEGVVHRRSSSFVEPYKASEEPENSLGAETPASPVISPLPVGTSENTEPRRRPKQNIWMPAKFKDFVLEK